MHKTLTVSDMMQKKIICFDIDTLLKEIVLAMQERRVSSVIICQESRAVGIITERDILKESLTPQESLSKNAAEVMSKAPLSIAHTMQYQEAYMLMSENNIRHLIIENEDKTVAGIISESDFLEHLTPEQLLAIKSVERVMIKSVITCSIDDSVATAIEKMKEQKISTLIIKQGSKAVGILSERDTIKLIQNSDAILAQSVSSIMTKPIISIHKKESVLASQALMKERSVRRLVVVDSEENMVGLLTRHDLVKNVPNYYIQMLKSIVEMQQNELNERVIFQNALYSLPYALLFATNSQGEIRFVSLKDKTLAQEIELAVSMYIETLTHPIFRLIREADAEGKMGEKNTLQEVIELSTQSGTTSYFQISLSKVLDTQGTFQGYIFIAKEITEKFHSQKRLRQSAKVFQNTTEGVMITDAKGFIIDVNSAFETITGYTLEESIGMRASLLRSGRHSKSFYQELWRSITQNGSWQGEIYNRRKDGKVYPQWLNISTVFSSTTEVENYIAVFSDISQLKESQKKLDFAMHHNHLTGLPNKTLLKARLEHTLNVAKLHSTFTAVIVMDLDNFKKINDIYGHSFGDKVLVSVSKRIALLLREDDTLAHLGGDTFIVVMNDFSTAESINVAAQRVIKTFHESYTVEDKVISLTASMGISIAPEDGLSSDVLLKNADAAMYEAKSDGRNSFKYYNNKMTSDIFERVLFENALRMAVERGEFELFYQPQQNLRDDSLVGFEALIRWNHPTLGRISPDKFIPIAEETKLIIEIGAFVLEQACRDILTWQKEGIFDARVAINVSGIQIEHSDFTQTLIDTIEKYAISPQMIEVEVTESIVMKSPQKWIQILTDIQNIGIAISIDDFGTGYSSLSYLRSLPVDTLKIDISFVQDVPQERDACAIANAIVAMAKSLGLTTIAEGIETAEQKAYFKSIECDQLQGFFLATPMSFKDTQEWLRAQL